MEENNNNNDNKIIEQGKQIVKDAVKSKAKGTGKKVFIKLLPYIGMLVVILLAIGVLNLITSTIASWFTSLFNPTKATATEEDTEILSVISIDEDGKYEVKSKEFAEKIKTTLEEKNIDLEDLKLETKNLDNLIEKYVETEFKTMLPKTGKFGNDLDGNVIIKRQAADGSDEKDLEYITYKKFMDKIKKQDSSVLDNFSINPENFNLMIAQPSSEEKYYYDYQGNLMSDRTYSSGIKIAGDEEEGIDYLTLIQNYGAPFNFFLSMHMVALDGDFMSDLVKYITNDSSPITLTYIESKTMTTSINNYNGVHNEYVKKESIQQDADGNIILPIQKLNVVGDKVSATTVNSSNIQKYLSTYSGVEIEDYWKLETYNCSGSIYVTNANTWLKHTEKTVTKNSTDDVTSTSPENPESYVYQSSLETTNDGTNIITKFSKLENFKKTVTTTTNSNNFTVVDSVNEIKVQEFIDFLNKYPGVVDNLTSAPSQLFHYLEEDEKTQTLGKVMRYVILNLTGVDYGVSSLEELEQLLSDKDFTKYVGVTGLISYLGQFGGKVPIDGYYMMYYDGANWPTIGRDDIQWKTYWNKFSKPGKVKHKGVEKEVADVAEYIRVNCLTKGHTAQYSKAEINNMDIGIEVALIEEVGEKNISTHTNSVLNHVDGLGLSRQQIFALTAVHYNFGHIPVRDGKTFRDVYLEAIDLGYEAKSWKHNKYVWDNWWGKLGGGQNGYTKTGHIKIRDAQFETYVKGVLDFSQSDAGTPYSRVYYLFYTKQQLDNFKVHLSSGNTIPYLPLNRTNENEEETFTMVEIIGEYTASSEKGVAGYYVSTTGREFTILNQCNISGWSDKCNQAASAIIASGFADETPDETINYMKAHYDGQYIPATGNYWNKYGLKRTKLAWEYVGVDDMVTLIRNQLSSGGYMACWLKRNGGYWGKSGTYWTDYIHWMAIIDYSIIDGKEQIAIADWRGVDWYDIDEYKYGINAYALIDIENAEEIEVVEEVEKDEDVENVE